MKLTNTEDAVVESAGLGETGSFTIKQSPKAFQILSSGLYSNKPLAIIRELTCNAYDAHVMVGRQKTPIEVKLPTRLDTQFYVKDFGPGLSDNQVMHLYTTYFDSTKTNSNDFIGGLGLGSKSPFSYTDSFTVESRQNGVAKTYGAFVNDDGIPTIALMSEQPTKDKDGLTVGFPVKPEDYNSFVYEARNFLRWMETPPDVKGATLSAQPVPEVSCVGIDVFKSYPGPDDVARHYYHHSAGSAYVRMGQVNYPIDWQAAGLKDDPLVQILNNANKCYLLHAPIGSLNVAASREGLQYDKQGRREIAELLKVFAGNLIDYVNKEAVKVGKSLSGFAAGTHMQSIISPWGFDIFNPKTLNLLETLSSKKLVSSVRDTLYTPLPPQLFKNFHVEYYKSSVFKSDSTDRRTLSSGSGEVISHHRSTMVVEKDTPGHMRALSELRSHTVSEPYYQKAVAKAAEAGMSFNYQSALVIVPNSMKVAESVEYKEEVAQFLKDIGSPHVRRTSEVARLVTARAISASSGKRPVEEILCYPIDQGGIHNYTDTINNVTNFAWLPLSVGDDSVTINGIDLQRHKAAELFYELFDVAAALGVVLPKIVGVSKLYQKRVVTFESAVTFDEALKAFFNDPIIIEKLKNPLHVVHASRSRRHDELMDLRRILNQIDPTVVDVNEPLRVIKEQHKSTCGEEPLARLLLNMKTLFGAGPKATVRSLEASKTFASFCTAYPLFSILTKHVTDDMLTRQAQLKRDITKYLADREDQSFAVKWNTVSIN